jgi:spermidine synthase
MVAGVLTMAFFLIRTELIFRDGYVTVQRNFYGVLRVRDDDPGQELERRSLVHGTISHGYQFDRYRDLAGSYYSTSSGVGRAILASQAYGPLRVGVIGLGVGVLASYAREGDLYTIYEINPDVVRMSSEHFDFVPRARERGAVVSVVLGDARLSLEEQPPQSFDVLALDAFSSDAIPTHLLTQEAIELYIKHLTPDGVLAVHISNRYLDLVPVCQRAAEHVGRPAIVIQESSGTMAHASSWVLITSNLDLLRKEPFQGAQIEAAIAPKDFRPWTDQYSNVWSVLKFWRGDDAEVTTAFAQEE